MTCDPTLKVSTEKVGEFQSEKYEDSKDFQHSWKHLRTGIVVWKDAIDLSAGPGAKAFFHYTEQLERNCGGMGDQAFALSH